MKKVLFMLLVMFALSACQSKDSYVKEFSAVSYTHLDVYKRQVPALGYGKWITFA